MLAVSKKPLLVWQPANHDSLADMDTAARRTHIAAQDATLLLVPAQAHLPPLLLPRIQRRRRHVLLPLLHHPQPNMVFRKSLLMRDAEVPTKRHLLE